MTYPLREQIFKFWREKTLHELSSCVQENSDSKIYLNSIQNSLIIYFRGKQYNGELNLSCIRNKMKDNTKLFLLRHLHEFFHIFRINSKKSQKLFRKTIKSVESEFQSDKFQKEFESISRNLSVQNISSTVFIMFYNVERSLRELFDKALTESGSSAEFEKAINTASDSVSKIWIAISIVAVLLFIGMVLLLAGIFGTCVSDS